MKAPHRNRRTQAGNTAVLVAVTATGMIAITGLALDGGMEAGAFRHAQNAADAGALAAARQEFFNAMATPPVASSTQSLTPVAKAEVERNHAQLAWISGGSSSSTSTTTSSTTAMAPGHGGSALAMADQANPGQNVQSMDAGGIGYSYTFADATISGSVTNTPLAYTSTQTVWVPATANGVTAQAALADMWGAAGTPLLPVNANLNLAGTSSTATAVPQASGGSVASSQVDLGQVSASGATSNINCYTATAHYTGSDSYAAGTPCPAGTSTVGVTATGTVLGVAATNVKVDRSDGPTALPRVIANTVNGGVGTAVSVSATQAASSNSLYWDPVNGITSTATVNATGVHAALATMTIDAASLLMTVSVWIDQNTGQPKIAMTCKPTTLTIHALVGTLATASVSVDSNCVSTGLSALGLGLTGPYVAPSLDPATACTTNNGTGQVSCSVQTCLLQAKVTAAINTSLCLGEANVSLSAVPVSLGCTGGSGCCTTSCSGGCTTNCSGGANPPNPLFSQFTGPITVAATVPQQTYFLRVLGWTQTLPTAEATADIEPVIDESDTAFMATPFGMPDSAYTMTGLFNYERLIPGHTYYIYGPSMQANDPAAAMPSGWQGQMSSSSPHRVDTTLTGTTALTTTPSAFLSRGPYWLIPVFNPVSGAVEYYGVFVPVSGNAHWGMLVNSIPASKGYLVPATSANTWNTFEEGAVAVKLQG